MKTKENKTENLVRVPEAALLALVAYRLKDQVLFPKQIERAKKLLENMKVTNLR